MRGCSRQPGGLAGAALTIGWSFAGGTTLSQALILQPGAARKPSSFA